MSRIVTVDFFRVHMFVPGRTFESLIDAVKAMTGANRNWAVTDDDVIRLHEVDIWGDCIEGEMTRLRMGDVPPKGDLSGSVTDLALEDDEGLGEQTAFLYDPKTRALLIQRSKMGVSSGRLTGYFEYMTRMPTPVIAEPSLRLDAVQRLAEITEVRSFQVNFARVDNPDAFKGLDLGNESFIDVMNEFKSPTADIRISMGRQEGTLPVEKIKKIALHLMQFGKPKGQAAHPNDVTKIDLSGRDDDGNSTGVDLVRDRLFEKVNVQRTTRRVLYPVRRDALREAYDRQVENLAKMYAAT